MGARADPPPPPLRGPTGLGKGKSARGHKDAPDRRGLGTPTWVLKEDPSAGERDAPAAVGPGGGVILDAWVLKKDPNLEAPHRGGKVGVWGRQKCA